MQSSVNLSIILNLLASIVSIYAFLCFLRVILTWIPSLAYSRGVKLLSSICDPFLDRFRHRKWLTLGSFDFGPAVALCVLGAASTMLNSLARGGKITVAYILASLLQLVWTIASSVISFIILLFIIRLIILLIKGDESYAGNPILYQLDSTISSVAYRITNTFTGGKRVSYKSALITAIIAMIIITFVGSLVFEFIARLLLTIIPF
ncbi:MAG: YggT family protein [Treponema sp.]|nr:YggT family protein [Treponema sp.]